MKRFCLIGLTIVLALLIALPTLARSQPAPTVATYDSSWYSIDGGGATFSTGGSYSLGGTIGQADAGSMNGGSYSIAGGFWGGVIVPTTSHHTVYLPLALK
jgi:hypothetical protein